MIGKYYFDIQVLLPVSLIYYANKLAPTCILNLYSIEASIPDEDSIGNL